MPHHDYCVLNHQGSATKNHMPILRCQVMYLNRFEDLVKWSWNCDPFNCEMDSQTKQTVKCLLQESRDIIIESLPKENKSIWGLQKETEQFRRKERLSSIYRFLHSTGAKNFHQIPAQNWRTSTKKIECGFVSFWATVLLTMFFSWPLLSFWNSQNDRI